MAETKLIAGHLFEGAGSDRKCVKLKQGSSTELCGKFFDDIRCVVIYNDDGSLDYSYYDKPGYAHVGSINRAEIEEVAADIKRQASLYDFSQFKQ